MLIDDLPDDLYRVVAGKLEECDNAAQAALRATCRALRQKHPPGTFGVAAAVASVRRLDWAIAECTWTGPSHSSECAAPVSHAIDVGGEASPTKRARVTTAVPVASFRFGAAAAASGNTVVLRHLRTCYGARFDERVAAAAVSGGNIGTLLELRSWGCPLGDASKLCELAAKHGHLAMLKHLIERELCAWDKWTARAAIEEGHVDVVAYLVEELGCPVDEGCAHRACHGGHLLMLRWLREKHGCAWNEGSFFCAARQGHVHIAEYLHAQGCPWNESACQGAARGGHLALLRWLRARGCPWNAWSTRAALEGGHHEVFWWCRAAGCPYA